MRRPVRRGQRLLEPLERSAFSPDVPGCVSTGATKDETARNMREALTLHLEALREAGSPLPEGSTPDAEAAILEVA